MNPTETHCQVNGWSRSYGRHLSAPEPATSAEAKTVASRIRSLEDHAAAVARDLARPDGAPALERLVRVEGSGRSGAYRLSGRLLARANAQPVCLVTVERLDEGLPPPRVQRRFGLTPRQAEVALLLADRRSNLQISERLRISIHTARRHTEKVYSKLDVHRREEVEAVLSRLALPPPQQVQ